MLRSLLVMLAWFGGGEDEGPDAEAALRGAFELRRESFGTKGEEKFRILSQAAAAYETVATRHADVVAVAAEAWFRAGEIQRTLRAAEEARRCFERAAALSEAPQFAARALNELGHLCRRTKDYDGALRFYAEVGQRFPDQRTECVRALTWSGKVLVLQEKVEEGHAVLLSVGEKFPDHPVDAIRCVDTVAVAWWKEGRTAEAEALVDRCLARWTPDPDATDRSARDVSEALEKMRARELIAEGAGAG